MSRIGLRLALLAVFFAQPAFAQIAGTPFEFSASGGVFAPDARARMKSAPSFGATLGWRAQSWLVFEGQVAFAGSNADSAPEQKFDFSQYGLDMRMNMRPADSRVVPYVLFGIADGASKTTGTLPDKLERGAPSIGLGALIIYRHRPTAVSSD